ncbi:hypothetical protein E8E11_002170 [Didymella keratinophila]|nr:hypothetical protein E8E11_002170 [Didymella keratinophila]
MVLNGFLASFIAAVQASLSVLLVISYGAIAAKLGLLNASNGKAISKICVKMFLPALLLVQIGSELHPGSASRYLIILLWAIICHFVSFLIGIFAHLVFGLPDWTTAAIMFNNTTSYPLLLIQSLEQTGILSKLLVEGETTGELVARAKSYFLVFATVSNSDDESTLDGEESNTPRQLENGDDADRPSEQTRLLSAGPQFRERHKSVTNITFFPSKPKFTSVKRRPQYIADLHWSDLSARTQWWLLFLYDFLNAPLVGALLGVLIGMTPVLYRAFFSSTYSGGVFTAWLTESWKNIGGLFVPLPLIVAGISLYTSYQESKHNDSSTARTNTPLATTAFILTVRFIVWPLVSIGVIYAFAKDSSMLGSDPMLWFAMMLMPTGPPAMKLITMVQVSDAGIEDERRTAKILTISYIISPILAVVVVGALNKTSNGVSLYRLNVDSGVDMTSGVGWDSMTEGDEVKGLRYFLAVGICNTETKQVICRAWNVKGWELSLRPGHIFERPWPETQALIGTPNLLGFAYFLTEQKDILGNMFIDKMQVFQSDTAAHNPSIVMYLSQPQAPDRVQQRNDDKSVVVEVVKTVELHPLWAKL